MNIKIFKFIDIYTNGIFVEFNNKENKSLSIHLLLNDEIIEKTETTGESHLFSIDKSGHYRVEISLEAEKTANIQSKEIYFHISEGERKNKIKTTTKEKTINQKIAGISNYYLDIKAKKKNYDKIKQDLTFYSKLPTLELKRSLIYDTLNEYDYFTFHGDGKFEILVELAEQIESLDYVEYCSVTPDTTGYLAPELPVNPEQLDDIKSESDDFITPDFTPRQTYLDAPKGMNIRDAWAKNINGSSAVVRHLDFGVYRNHEDLIDSNIVVVNSRPESEDCNHGTASTGCIVATLNKFGVTGIAHHCQFYFYDTGDLDLIVNHVQPGDIVSLDIQFSVGGKLLPATAIRSWWERMKIIVDKGATVILAAGNGGLDLSEPGVMQDFGDSGSILVGACNHQNGTRAYFSNYNPEVAFVNSWGDWSVTTTGYGSLQKLPGNNRNYSNNYSGTSSATPLCSGALALIQDYAKKQGAILSPWQMRTVIAASNYTEGVSHGIGCRPNVDYLFGIVDSIIRKSDLPESA
ncbi:S8 family serine peptidase [Providencia sp. PROV259]|uniref:S8 family serine peptidase n=1 Tax=Providencia sp. PROV259 TaxID=2949947 RepID=UPI00234B13FA|nr:S8 family serine peptidase [Providencia sp. PROV259]